MKKKFVIIALVCLNNIANAQIVDPGRVAKRSAENRVNQKIDQGVDKGLDKAEEAIGGIFKKKKSSRSEDSNETSSATKDKNRTNNNTDGNNEEAAAFDVVGKYDFVPGEKVIAIEDFSQDALGDFPAKWNSNGSGELVKINANKNKYLKLNTETVLYPEFINGLPENFTVEFDLSSTQEYSFYSSDLIFGFTDVANVGSSWELFKRFGDRRTTKSTIEVGLHPTNAGGGMGTTALNTYSGGQEVLRNEKDQAAFQTNKNKTNVHVAVWRQKNRLRVYVNEEKIWDVPRAFAEGIKINSIYFRYNNAHNQTDAMYFGNIRVAVGAPDTRNKLITEGKFVTTGILFDVNSDKIKPESYGVLKEIANVLSENEEVKVKIIGHTDSDGDDATNLSLSKKRADAVKKELSSKFGINDNRMLTDGKGESQPAVPNTTAEGKANNRRVEFIKQ